MATATPRIDFLAPVFRVTDLPRSLDFYCQRLGFEVEFDYDGFYASVLRDGCRLHLTCAPPLPRDTAGLQAADHLDACCGVADARALADSFVAAGATLSTPVRDQPYGREFYVTDPDGYVLGFVQAT